MSINGVSTNYYPTAYTNTNAPKSTETPSFADTMGKTANVNGGHTFHWFKNDEGDKAIGACGLKGGGSATVYKPADFDPENPVYKVKAWDAAGNVTEERMVDVSKIDPQNSNFLDMLAYSGHLADSGEYPGAFSAFIDSTANPPSSGSVYDSYLDKMDWKGIAKYYMQLQYDLGNISGYMLYKKFWDFLEQHSFYQ